jgi:hypothetical protein
MPIFEGLDSRVVLVIFLVALVLVIAGVMVSNWMSSRRGGGSDKGDDKRG